MRSIRLLVSAMADAVLEGKAIRKGGDIDEVLEDAGSGETDFGDDASDEDLLGASTRKAMERLRRAHDSMREALGEDIEPRLRGLLQGHAEGTAVTTNHSRMDIPAIKPPRVRS